MFLFKSRHTLETVTSCITVIGFLSLPSPAYYIINRFFWLDIPCLLSLLMISTWVNCNIFCTELLYFLLTHWTPMLVELQCEASILEAWLKCRQLHRQIGYSGPWFQLTDLFLQICTGEDTATLLSYHNYILQLLSACVLHMTKYGNANTSRCGAHYVIIMNIIGGHLNIHEAAWESQSFPLKTQFIAGLILFHPGLAFSQPSSLTTLHRSPKNPG